MDGAFHGWSAHSSAFPNESQGGNSVLSFWQSGISIMNVRLFAGEMQTRVDKLQSTRSRFSISPCVGKGRCREPKIKCMI